ncbi:hypothetical protein VTH06DRAFT_6811 [Thermothelomyces fergusii]
MKFSLLASSALLALASAAAVESPRPKSYDGYKVVRVSVGDNAAKVQDLIDRLGLETWKGKPQPGAVADIVIPPSQIDAFTAETAGLDVITMHEDLGASIAAETTFQAYAAGSANATWFQSYHSFNDHIQFLNDLQQQFSSRAEIVSSGKSLNGRDITGLHIWGSSGKGKPAVVFHGTVHAREWITTMVVEYLAYYLLNNQGSSEVANFLNKYDFYFFPFVNPDGFVYTQTNDRLWRKNRQSTSGSSCLGHDINRNWDYKWDVSGGASTNPCAQDFRGSRAADAPETQALSAWLLKTKQSQGIKLFIDWHSYSQLFMTPYGYSCTAVAPNNSELQSLAQGAAAAIRAVHGTSFRTGPICSTIYKATGNSVDYVKDVVGADYIVPSGEETYAGVRYLLQNMK